MLAIIEREFISILRTRKALAFQLLLVLGFSLLIVVRWPTDARVDLSGVQSQQVFRIFSYGLLLSIVLLAPVFPATSVVSERLGGTLALLLNSPLHPGSIYWGKFVALIGFTCLVFVFSLPAAMACYAMGGVSLSHQLLWLYLALALLVIQYTSLALLVSSYASSTDAALRITYGLVLCLSIFSLGPHLFLQGKPGLMPVIAEWLRCLSPVPVIMTLVGHGDVGGQGFAAAGGVPQRFALLTLLSSGALIGAALARLNHRIFDRSRSQGTITDEQTLAVRTARRLMYVVDPQRRKSGIPWFANPVMVKEFRCRRFGRLHWLLRLVAACALVSVLLTFAAATGTMDWGVQTIGGLLVLMQAALVVMITPSLAAGLISGELEAGGWDLLRMTPLSSVSVVSGKLLSVVWTLLLVLCATLPGYLLITWIAPDLWVQVYHVIISLILTAVLCLTVSAAISTFFRRTAPAVAVSYIVLNVIFAGTMLVWLGRDAPFGHELVETILMINPMAAALSIMQTPGFEIYELVPANWWFTCGTSGLAFILLAYRTWYLMRPR